MRTGVRRGAESIAGYDAVLLSIFKLPPLKSLSLPTIIDVWPSANAIFKA